MTEHVLKTREPYYDAVARGEKRFEVRFDDRGFQRGDVLVLRRWSHRLGWLDDPRDALRFRVGYILTGGRFGIEPGFVVMGLESEA